MDPDQTAPLGPHCLSKKLKYFSGPQNIHFFVICALSRCEKFHSPARIGMLTSGSGQ